jgi:hypothetical protein
MLKNVTNYGDNFVIYIYPIDIIIRCISNTGYDNILISCLLSGWHQTLDRISAYPVYILSCQYPTLYHILSLSYPDHQTGLWGSG